MSYDDIKDFQASGPTKSAVGWKLAEPIVKGEPNEGAMLQV